MEPDKNPFVALASALEPLTGKRTIAGRLKEVEELPVVASQVADRNG